MEERIRNAKYLVGRTAGEVMDEQSASEGRMVGDNVKTNEQLERKKNQEQLVKKNEDKKVEEKKMNTKKKQKRMTVTDELGKKRIKQEEENIAERAELLIRADAIPHSTSNICMTPERSDINTEMHAESTNHNGVVTNKPNEIMEVLNNLVADGSLTQQQDSDVVDKCTLPTQIRYRTTDTQLTMMKKAFSDCQYPDTMEYYRLSQVIDIPRNVLVQWYGDMRYYVKKIKPRWMNEEQHDKALDNIMYRQGLTLLLRTQE
ncbi:homeobox and leucine zipper encoding b isoform X1 [Cottoperca gobio]|uniref:Uncharacterized protein LOC115023778 isoform X1 n=1 Tax=Cottoperca gobio TaxID=56716 RepID=A0A6J2RKX8_COTGO|nr:uncharacterized protein LOC115023778 isoform X1 [Cottoperca gobio]XP_029310877.1 uncharacterized protein LOC115023778 isoform X1 [Cottoperca gobio]XP_029310878.1 uncharacterized protein LOC115023778 isoform X1 [Cottoperca gobio]